MLPVFFTTLIGLLFATVGGKILYAGVNEVSVIIVIAGSL